MIVMETRVDIHHPLRLLQENEGVGATFLVCHRTPEGPVTGHLVRAGPQIQRMYEMLWKAETRGVGRRLEKLKAGKREAIYLHGPCTCDGTSPVCREVASLLSGLATRVEGNLQRVELRFGDGKPRCRCISLEPRASGEWRSRRTPALREARDFPGTVVKWQLGLPILSELERETLEASLQLGYFDGPRGCTMEELANVLDVSTSTACYRLQNLQQNVMKSLGYLEWLQPSPPTP